MMSNLEILLKVLGLIPPCVAADHEKRDSYDHVVTSKYPHLLRTMG